MTEGQVSLQTLLEPGRTISYGILKTGLFVEAGVPTVQAGSIRNFTVKRSELKTVSESLSNEFSRTILRGGEILVAIRGTVGNVAVANADLIGCNVSREVAVIPIRQGVDEQYVMHMLATRDGQNQIRGYIKGIAQSGINLEDLRRCKVPLPPLEEQRRIAAILDAADALREKRGQALALVEQLTQSVFREMFASTTFPRVTLAEFLRFLTSGSRGWAKYYSSSGSPFLRIQNVRRGELNLSDMAYVNPPSSAEANRTRVRSGDVLLSITADLGRAAVVTDGLSGSYINQHLALLRVSPEVVPTYLVVAISSTDGRNQFAKLNKGGVKAGLNFDDIRAFEIPLPPLELQQEFARRVEVIEKLKVAHQQSLKEMDALFASLQHRAFRGEL